jgi:hypothetical protein
VLLDDTLDRVLKIPFPHPAGFELVARRSYRGLWPFTMLTYRTKTR